MRIVVYLSLVFCVLGSGSAGGAEAVVGEASTPGAAEHLSPIPASTANSAVPAKAGKRFATLFAFAPDPCHLRDQRPVYEFIDEQARFYPDLKCVYLSMDGDPAVIRFYETKEDQEAALVDSANMSVEQLRELLKTQLEREAKGLPPPNEHISETIIREMSSEQIVELLAKEHVERGFANPNWQAPEVPESIEDKIKRNQDPIFDQMNWDSLHLFSDAELEAIDAAKRAPGQQFNQRPKKPATVETNAAEPSVKTEL